MTRPGDRLGERFELLELSRIGGMGEVWARARRGGMLYTTLTSTPAGATGEVSASARLVEHLVIAGLPDLARNFVARTALLDPAWLEEHPAARGRLRAAEAALARFEGDAEHAATRALAARLLGRG